jgi:lysophospholipase L1-like esterase
MRRKVFLLVATTCVIACCLTLARSQQTAGSSSQWDPEIKKFEEADRQHPPARGGVLFIGSSSIRLWQSLAEDFPKVKTINRGFGGSEIADATRYVDRIVVPYRPRMVVLYSGDNDLANGKTPQRVFADYKDFIRRVRRQLPQTRIAFVSIKPSPARLPLLPNIETANALIKDYSAPKRNLIYVDVFTRMLGENGTPRPELFVADGLHLSRAGYELWTSIISPYVR